MLGMRSLVALIGVGLFAGLGQPVDALDHGFGHRPIYPVRPFHPRVQLGPRPYFLVEDMEDSWLKDKLMSCANRPFFTKTPFSIAHRGACMQFPEHTRESYVAAARMGAGIVECDVTFTADRELVCRHSQCDLHTTTNIVATDLSEKCTRPFEPAEFDASGNLVRAASARCCTSDITLEEFKSLRGKMDASNPEATTPEDYLGGTANWRTDLYAGATSGTLMTHAESIELFKSLGVKMTPELKAPSVEMPFEGEYTQQDYAQQMIDEYVHARVPPRYVYPQSFNLEDVLYWIENTRFGEQAVYLDGRYDDEDFDHTDPTTWSPTMEELVERGVEIIAPPMWMLVAEDDGAIVPSTYAKAAKAAGLDIITWTLERSGVLGDGEGGWYYQTINGVVSREGDIMRVLDVLAQDVGILGIFSDWPATVTYYANCMGLRR